jgi:hypothetical protein
VLNLQEGVLHHHAVRGRGVAVRRLPGWCEVNPGEDDAGAAGGRAGWPLLTGSDRVNRPSRYIAGRLICALNVGSALAE